MKFKLTSACGYPSSVYQDAELDEASAAGWHNSARGEEILSALEVGQRARDEDGDYWERTA